MRLVVAVQRPAFAFDNYGVAGIAARAYFWQILASGAVPEYCAVAVARVVTIAPHKVEKLAIVKVASIAMNAHLPIRFTADADFDWYCAAHV